MLDIEGAYKEGILDREYHERLLSDLDRIVCAAHLPKDAILMRLSEYCSPAEQAWVRQIRRENAAGIVYVGEKKVPSMDRMMAITATLLRNYINARIMPVQEVVSHLKADDMPSPTVLLVPNFFLDKANGGDIPSWQVSGLLGMLYSRLVEGGKTILYVSSMENLGSVYGTTMRKHLESHYLIV